MDFDNKKELYLAVAFVVGAGLLVVLHRNTATATASSVGDNALQGGYTTASTVFVPTSSYDLHYETNNGTIIYNTNTNGAPSTTYSPPPTNQAPVVNPVQQTPAPASPTTPTQATSTKPTSAPTPTPVVTPPPTSQPPVQVSHPTSTSTSTPVMVQTGQGSGSVTTHQTYVTNAPNQGNVVGGTATTAHGTVTLNAYGQVIGGSQAAANDYYSNIKV